LERSVYWGMSFGLNKHVDIDVISCSWLNVVPESERPTERVWDAGLLKGSVQRQGFLRKRRFSH